MGRKVQHISREEAIANAVRWALERNWTLARSAREMGLVTATLRVWLHQDGWRCEFRRMWVKKDSGPVGEGTGPE